jgi:hypothetical protein
VFHSITFFVCLISLSSLPLSATSGFIISALKNIINVEIPQNSDGTYTIEIEPEIWAAFKRVVDRNKRNRKRRAQLS